jgi:hypothetical protein
MILFYSNSCQHCSVLIDTIKKHDTKKTIKLVCIDTIVNTIKHKITNVPALMFMPSKELIYGKAVFDYLLLPNRGYLFTSNSTREKTQTNNTNSQSPLNNNTDSNEPMAFSLGSVLTDNFSNIDDDNINSTNINNDRIYNWDFIDNTNTTSTSNSTTMPPPINTIENEYKAQSTKTENKKLPSLEELTQEREKLFKDIK